MADGQGFDIPAGTIVLETAVDLEGMKRDMDRGLRPAAERAGERAGAGFGDGFRKKAGKEAVKGAREGLKKLGEDAEKSGKKVDEADSSLKEWSSTADEAAQTGAGLALIFSNRLASGLRGLKGALVRGTSALVSWTASGVRVAAEGLRGLGQEMRDSSNAMTQKFAPAVEVTGTALSGVAGLLAQAAQAVTALKLTVLGSSTALNVAAANEADNFEESWNRVLTLIPESVDGLDSLKREVSELGAELGVTAETTNDTFYQVLSAMPQVAQRPREALDILQVALETAATGFADGATAAKAITGVLNAFQMEADQAREVTDKLFAAQQQGVLTFQDIATEINKVSGITNALGGDFEDLLAIVSTMTGEFSARVPETFTQVQGVIRSIVDPSTEAAEAAKQMGEDFALSADLIREHGLVGAIERIVEVTEGSPEAISQIIPEANAQQLIISLAGRMGALEGRLNSINSTGGLTKETLDEVNERWGRQKAIFSETFKNDLRQIGFLYNDIRTNVLGAVNALRQLGAHGEGGFASLSVGARDAGFEMIDQATQLGDRWDRITGEVTEFTDSVLGIPPSMVEVEDRTRRVQRIMDVLERNGLEVAELFDVTNENADQWVDTLIESELALEDVEERVRRILRLQELVGPARDNFADQLTPRMAEVLGMDPGEMRREAEEDVESIDRPTSPTEAQIAAIETRRARMRVEAFRDFLETGNEEAYQAQLDAIQGEINELVMDRFRLLRQHGAEAEDLQKLIGLYDRSVEQTSALDRQIRQLAEAFGLSQEAASVFRRALERMPGEGAPLPPGFESEEELTRAASDFESTLRPLLDRIRELEEAGASSDEVFRVLQKEMDDAGISMEELSESTEGLARVIIRKLLKAGLPAWFLRVSEGADGAGDAASELREDLQEMATVAGGILNVADALGVLGDDARQALGGVQSLVSALGQTAEEGGGFLGTGLTAGGFAGVLGAGASILSGVIGGLFGGGEDPEERRVREAMERLRSSVERLKDSIDRQREALSGLPGNVVQATRSLLRRLEEQGPGSRISLADLTIRLEDIMDRLGLSITDLVTLVESFDLPTEGLEDFLRGGADFDAFQELSAEQQAELREIFRQLPDLVETDLDELFGTFRGQMSLVRQEFELFDEAFDEPLDKLRRMRDLFLEFSDLPGDLRSRLAGADLSTAEGRQQLEATLQAIFRMIQSGDLPSGSLGELTLDQFREMLTELEGLADEAGGEERGGRAEEFSRTRTVTQVTGMRMVGILTTMDFRLAQLVEIGRRIVGGPEVELVDVPPAPQMAPAGTAVSSSVEVSATVERGAVAEGAIQVSGADDPMETASAVGDELAERVSRAIADQILDQLRGAGVRNPRRALRTEG